jgi:hypothetical protein
MIMKTSRVQAFGMLRVVTRRNGLKNLSVGPLAACLAVALAMLASATPAVAGIWTDSDGSHLWSHPANWQSGTVPTLHEPVSFDGNYTNDGCTIDLSPPLLGNVTLSLSYSGTVVLSPGLTLSLPQFVMHSGTLITSGGTVINASQFFDVIGGTLQQTATDVINVFTLASLVNTSFGVVNLTPGGGINGSNTFAQLYVIGTTQAKAIAVEPGTTQVITGSLTLQGVSPSAPLTVVSGQPGSTWFIDARGSRSLTNLVVSDSTNKNATPMTVTNGVDGGNNHGWTFLAAVPALPSWALLLLTGTMLALASLRAVRDRELHPVDTKRRLVEKDTLETR